MKLKCSLLIATLILAGSAFSQNLLKLDNNPNAPTGTHVYADATTCIADAVDGDIIYVIPSADGYGDIVIDKELHFIGSGLVADTETGYNSKINSIVYKNVKNIKNILQFKIYQKHVKQKII